eukprot:3868481-Prymnesium_polylepis.1
MPLFSFSLFVVLWLVFFVGTALGTECPKCFGSLGACKFKTGGVCPLSQVWLRPTPPSSPQEPGYLASRAS